MKVRFFQEHLPNYREEFFKLLSRLCNIELILYGADKTSKGLFLSTGVSSLKIKSNFILKYFMFFNPLKYSNPI